MTHHALARRQVVLLAFPFSDLSAQKLRPALVLADAGRDDWVLCQITSKPYADSRAVELLDTAFAQGGLQLASYARPGKLFTAHSSLIRSVVGELNEAAHQRVLETVVSLLRDGTAPA